MNVKTFQEMLAEQQQKQHRRTPRDIEHRCQCACVCWFRTQYPELRYALFAVPNGGRRDATTGAKLKAEGVVAGVSALMLLVKRGKYGALLIEMKAPHGRQSEEQKAFQVYCESAGYKYVICRSREEFRNEVQGYLILNSK